uniref:Uncharacterized protein n=1 Tax=Branchiostoma floridae TaxID=7739 RepID=C3Z168_BRAFL|eukprot:XP_002597755.1 hypothetical protein BRAFLDRAFT_77342 [Branchiostoma floridae]
MTPSMRPGTSIPLLQLDRMPFGLIQYKLGFYNATNVYQISTSPDYAVWLETMSDEFPTWFMRLFRGPGWSGVARKKELARTSQRCAAKSPSQNRFTPTATVEGTAVTEWGRSAFMTPVCCSGRKTDEQGKFIRTAMDHAERRNESGTGSYGVCSKT